MIHRDGVGEVDFWPVFDALPTPYVLLDRELAIVAANAAYLVSTSRTIKQLQGRYLFDAFPPLPGALEADGTNRALVVLTQIRDTCLPAAMGVQQYDIVLDDGSTSERYWLLAGGPILDAERRTELIAWRAEDVTEFLAEQGSGDEELMRRYAAVEADLFLQAKSLAAALRAKEVLASRLRSLADVALQLTEADTVQDLERIVVSRGLKVLGADGGAIISADVGGGWRATLSPALGTSVELIYGHVPYDSPLPAPFVARTGTRILLPTQQEGLAFDASMADVYSDTHRLGWAFLPLSVRDQCHGSLAVAWAQEHPLSPDELELLEGFAAQCAQALARIRTSEEKLVAAKAALSLSESLQRSLLSDPPAPNVLQIAARYQPAAQLVQVGGDWYDAFLTSDGVMTLVVGDVAGHDQDAAAAMAQVRNVLRGVAQVVVDHPAAVLSSLDRALRGLDVNVLATAVLCQVHTNAGPTQGGQVLRWCNAGHPPPLLVHPDGQATLLGIHPDAADPDLLIGLTSGIERTDHEVLLEPGSTLVLYTDGLVERRHEDLDVGLERLRQQAQGLHTLSTDAAADLLLATLATGAQDDVALMVLRTPA